MSVTNKDRENTENKRAYEFDFAGDLSGEFVFNFLPDCPYIEIDTEKTIFGLHVPKNFLETGKNISCNLKIILEHESQELEYYAHASIKEGPISILGNKKPDDIYFLVFDNGILSYSLILNSKIIVSNIQVLQGKSLLDEFQVLG